MTPLLRVLNVPVGQQSEKIVASCEYNWHNPPLCAKHSTGKTGVTTYGIPKWPVKILLYRFMPFLSATVSDGDKIYEKAKTSLTILAK